MIGYGGLTAVVLLSARGMLSAPLLRTVAAVFLTHVIMVWAFRYEWQFALAVRNGYAGFIMFDGALPLILVSTISRERVARLLIHIAFVAVTIGALGATFLYTEQDRAQAGLGDDPSRPISMGLDSAPRSG
jgi:hypothetical protein